MFESKSDKQESRKMWDDSYVSEYLIIMNNWMHLIIQYITIFISTWSIKLSLSILSKNERLTSIELLVDEIKRFLWTTYQPARSSFTNFPRVISVSFDKQMKSFLIHVSNEMKIKIDENCHRSNYEVWLNLISERNAISWRYNIARATHKKEKSSHPWSWQSF